MRADRNEAALEVACRLFFAGALALFSVRIFRAFSITGAPHLLLLLGGELLSVVLVLSARRARHADRSWAPLAATVVSTFYFFFVRLDYGTPVLPELLCNAIQLCGIGTQIAAKLRLGRSYGVLPELRGLVTDGPYRWVRHPIYLGYLINHVGFLLANASAWNLGVYALLYVILYLRMLQEEHVLARDPAFADYKRSVRHRLIPGLF